MRESEAPASGALRERVHEIIFEADTFEGKLFDVALLIVIAASVLAVMLESVESIDAGYHRALRAFDIAITALFLIEYVVRLWCVKRPLRYAISFYGVVDLLAIVPGVASLAFDGTQSLMVIRALRLLRVFRVLKLGHHVSEARVLVAALEASGRKITVFLGAVIMIVIIMGSLMYTIEGADNGFTSIPRSVYWAIVTMTTVGYGDIAPQTIPGQTIAALVMIAGYGIIAVPTGIVSVELANAHKLVSTKSCRVCAKDGHDYDARHCKHCGAAL